MVKASLWLVLGLTFNQGNSGMAKLEDILKIKAYKKQLSPFRTASINGEDDPTPSEPEQDPEEQAGQDVIPSFPGDKPPIINQNETNLNPRTETNLNPEVLKKRKKVRMVLDALKGSE